MKLIGKRGIPKDVFSGNPAISNYKLILIDGTFKRGLYSYVTKKWIMIESFKVSIDGLKGDSDLMWFDIEKPKKKLEKQKSDGECEECGNLLDEHAENGFCFDCVMKSCTPGNHY